ncbi:hypothetical protein OHO83_38215 [Streptomyces sp. NBC_00569]|uniref:hypothetical protein n=1 Tax=Streptomyces sp. NBC_00569 TaxID=2975780 RepID=UPI002E809C8C|nr:hypothetical protein [Streptomyces sp. NBC_00569]WUB97693.1 hypothetical protein OHO83_38215 [Streptomyces sp. NBC_00569]
MLEHPDGRMLIPLCECGVAGMRADEASRLLPLPDADLLRLLKKLSDSEAAGRYHVQRYLSEAVPWSYAFGFPPWDRKRGEERWHPRLDRGDWVDRVHGTLDVLARGARGARDASGHLGEVPIDRDQRTFILPPYVEAMRRSTPGQFEPLSDAEVPAAPQTVIVERKPKRTRKRK